MRLSWREIFPWLILFTLIAGFGYSLTAEVRWDAIYQAMPRLLDGAILTLEMVSISVIAGLLLALPLGIARASGKFWLGAVPYVYIFFFRGTPLLVQLFLLYYGLSQFEVVRESALWTGGHFATTLNLGFTQWHLDMQIPGLQEPFVCAVVTMTLHTSAYIAEIIRGAIKAVPTGEIEAARALGMSKSQAMRHIILPRAARIGLPAYSNEVILMLKASALASTITLMDLTGVAQTIIAGNNLAIEIYLAAGMLYLLMSFILIQLFRLFERWLRVDALQGR